MNFTVVLAAGSRAPQNMPQGLTASHMLTVVNGRPILSWVVRDILKKTDDQVILVCDGDDDELISFYKRRYKQHARVEQALLLNSPSINHSLKVGLDAIDAESKISNSRVRVVLGDTFLLGVEYTQEDAVYIADFSYASDIWCVASLDENQQIACYHNKKKGLTSPDYKAIVGRYEFSSFSLLQASLESVLARHERELSFVLEAYAEHKPLEAREISTESWIDFGHLEGVSKANRQLIESRSFNALTINAIIPEILKKSANKQKMMTELYWYQQLPKSLKALVPNIIDSHECDTHYAICMEYHGYGTLAEKFVYFELPMSFWTFVLTKLLDIIALFKKYAHEVSPAAIDLQAIYEHKTFSRLDALSRQRPEWGVLLAEDYIKINGKAYKNLNLLSDKITEKNRHLIKTGDVAIVHGDLCFNNILFDINSGVVKLIDPRGEFGGKTPSCLGDVRYDLAKLRHSFCGNYDCVIESDFQLSGAGSEFQFEIYKAGQAEREALFDKLMVEYGYEPTDIRYIEGLLFLSMIPLHQDSYKKQKAFWLSGIMALNEFFWGNS